MLGRLEKAFDCPSLTAQPHEIDTRIGMGRGDKAELSFAISALEPEPGQCQREVDVMESELATSFSAAIGVFDVAPIAESAIDPNPDDGPPASFSDCLKEVDSAKLGVRLDNDGSTCYQALRDGGKQLTGQLTRGCLPLAAPNAKAPRDPPITNEHVQHHQVQSPFAIEHPHPRVGTIRPFTLTT